MSPELTAIVAQFGPAGLMGLLWIMERRHAATRERHLSEAHQRLAQRDDSVHALLGVVRDNTRAIAALEHTQRNLVRLAERLNDRLGRPAGRSAAAGGTAAQAAA
jgi:predicted component of type VI protein secretion system